MESRPDIDESALAGTVAAAWSIVVAGLDFLPVGADPDSAAWRVTVKRGPPLFLKLRKQGIDPVGLAVARHLHDQGVPEVVAPLSTGSGALAVPFGPAALVLYPYIEGRDGFSAPLPPDAIRALGSALRRVHETSLPQSLRGRLGIEDWSPRWRQAVLDLLGQLATIEGDNVVTGLTSLLSAREREVRLIADRAASLAGRLGARTMEPVLCHTDLHHGNVLVGADGIAHIVDWDAPKRAPRERDLMFVGAGVGGTRQDPEEEAAQFHAGYGAVTTDPAAIAYYRYERIVEDIAATAGEVLRGPGPDRQLSLSQLAAQFEPGNVVAMAHASFARLAAEPRD
jgi:spectinomycin phosphotransferase